MKNIKLKEKVETDLADLKYLCMTTDTWAESHTVKTHLGLLIHYFKDEKLQSVILGTAPLDQSHTDEYLSNKIKELCTSFKIKSDSVVALVKDNGANIVKAAEIIIGIERYLSCFGHTIQLVPSIAIKETPGVQELISEVKHIISFFKKSANAADALRCLPVAQGEIEGTCLKLLQDVDTRWNSKFFMLKRFLDLSPLISCALLFVPNMPSMLSPEKVDALKEIVEILRPIEQATRELSSQDYASSSVVIPMVSCVMKTLDSINLINPIAFHLQTNLINQMVNRFSKVEENNLYAKAAILDPRF